MAGQAPVTRWGSPTVRVLGLILAASLVIPVMLVLALGLRGLELTGLLFAYLVPPLSKETVLPMALAAGFDPWVTVLAFTAVDAVLCATAAWGWEGLRGGRRIGPRLQAWEARLAARRAEHRRTPRHTRHRLHRLRWPAKAGAMGATLAFLVVPFQGSGAFTSSLLGRFLGLSPRTTFLIVVPAVAAFNVVWAFAATWLLRAMGPLGLVLLVVSLAVMAAAVAGAALLGRRPREPAPAPG